MAWMFYFSFRMLLFYGSTSSDPAPSRASNLPNVTIQTSSSAPNSSKQSPAAYNVTMMKMQVSYLLQFETKRNTVFTITIRSYISIRYTCCSSTRTKVRKSLHLDPAECQCTSWTVVRHGLLLYQHVRKNLTHFLLRTFRQPYLLYTGVSVNYTGS